MKNSHKGFSTLFILFIIVILIAGGVYIYYHFGRQNILKGGSYDKFEATSSSSISDIEKNIVGTWQSIDDKKDVLTFYANKTYTELYDGKSGDTGTWSLQPNLQGTPYEQDGYGTDVYLKEVVTDASQTIDPLYMGVDI